ncbi:NAD-dependent succinate-semialdehyde dehydrogenase [Celerinatantimonas diazotrophica]|uniref:Succinate-semialdehyde dehydrogenase/glutarate-semialdehyde dehydrogenase n=1 Tax=Celerinatantimonas diazotrophica TaxID=412034 RepID=A0A4V2PNK9_9GAMM|nr:NAD-dependent succinate-semialdehyde dehydrogenase [Celerinatantimonas diazotrophica]TCK47431.1 succinate-semialdehyde dehydrogenase/glutarate-semialdehyde dehydrogenase [Celerinatantimonas diazotrophica]CAG9294951.1 Succinate-semialdehyde dehydrogenase [NADP(+)] GabD [Celerinatantimonas diazotrophica]
MQLSDPSLLCHQSFIDGKWCDAADGRQFTVYNPATGESLAEVADCAQIETEQAIRAAQEALNEWRALTAKVRANYLRQWFELIQANQQDLAILMTLEQGKALTEAQGEVAYGASFVEWFAEEGKRQYGEVIPATNSKQRLLTIRQPIGVVAAITPWNFPIAMITRKAAPALAAGCTMVIKPSEETPLCALALAQLADRAGIPAGVLNIVVGRDSKVIGETLTSSSIVRKLSFTGSTPVGKFLLQQCADTVKRTSMELGGNAPFIVFDDADLDKAVEGVLASKYRNSGQTCVCANRILVQSGVYDAFCEKLVQAVQSFKLGNGLEPGVNMGPLINQAAIDKVELLVAQAISAGAQVRLGGQAQTDSLFYQPTVLTEVSAEMDIFHHEIFGPVAPLVRFDSEQQAIELANHTPFGLAAYFYARDMSRIWRVSEALEYGMVGINEGLISNEVAPFGGVKESGIGREGSRHGIDEYSEIKYLCMSVD